MNTTTLTNDHRTAEDQAVIDRLHNARALNQHWDNTDYRAMLAREQDKADARDAAEWREAMQANARAEGAWEDAGCTPTEAA